MENIMTKCYYCTKEVKTSEDVSDKRVFHSKCWQQFDLLKKVNGNIPLKVLKLRGIHG